MGPVGDFLDFCIGFNELSARSSVRILPLKMGEATHPRMVLVLGGFFTK